MRAANLIEDIVKQPTAWSMLNAASLTAWLELLPEHILQARPHLRLYQARSLIVRGQPQTADTILQALEAELQQERPTRPDSGALIEQIAADRGVALVPRGARHGGGRGCAAALADAGRLPKDRSDGKEDSSENSL